MSRPLKLWGWLTAVVVLGLVAVPIVAASADTASTDLKLALGVISGPIPVGPSSEFGFQVLAVGGTATESASVTVTLPPELQFLRASVDSATPLTTCSTAGATTTCGLGTITATPQTGPDIYITFKAGPNAVPNMRYRATASISGALPDPDSSNNSSYQTVRIVPTSNLIPSVSPTTLIRGRTNWVTVSVKNDGPDPASEVQFTYLYVHGAGFEWAAGADLAWHAAGLLQPGHSLSKSFPIMVSPSAHSGIIGNAPVAANNANPQCTAQQCAVVIPLTARDAQPTLAETGGPTGALLAWGLALTSLGSLTTIAGRRRATVM